MSVDWSSVSQIVAPIVSAVASVGALLIAILAAHWVKKAYEESRKQAEAAIAQVGLATQQLADSQPIPILNLVLKWTLASSPAPQLYVENLGSELAFDIRLSNLDFTPSFGTLGQPAGRYVTFKPMSHIQPGQSSNPRMEFPGLSKSPNIPGVLSTANIQVFLEDVGSTAPAVDGTKYALAKIDVTYRNIRKQSFNASFMVVLEGKRFECLPEGSLLGINSLMV